MLTVITFCDKNFQKYLLIQNKRSLRKVYWHGHGLANYMCSNQLLKCQVMKLINLIFIFQANCLFLFIQSDVVPYCAFSAYSTTWSFYLLMLCFNALYFFFYFVYYNNYGPQRDLFLKPPRAAPVKSKATT